MEHTPTYVIYHADCRDGFGAAWAAWTVLGDRKVHYLPRHYGDPLPDTDPAGRVYILDYSYDLPTMQRLLARHRGRVTLLDHHASAQEALDGRIAGATFDQEHSGAVMAWEHFHPDEPVPQLLLYVQDRDLWQWALPGSREINQALQEAPADFALWSAFSIPDLLEEGRRLRAPALEQIQRSLDSLGTSQVLGIPVPSVETDQMVSETAERMLAQYPTAAFAAVYYHTEQDGRPATKFSLRSRSGGTDVSALARQLGGGGHANAAGFTVTDNTRTEPRPELHPSDPRHHGTEGLAQLAAMPPAERTRDQQAALDLITELQAAANENALLQAGDEKGASQLWDLYGHRHMTNAHQLARAFPNELPLPTVQLDPDPGRDAALKRALYPGALACPPPEQFHENQ